MRHGIVPSIHGLQFGFVCIKSALQFVDEQMRASIVGSYGLRGEQFPLFSALVAHLYKTRVHIRVDRAKAHITYVSITPIMLIYLLK